MKNQFFGDKRDFFKYDLHLSVLRELQLERFTLVPLLTPNDATTAGRITRYTRRQRSKEIFDFLQDCLRQERRHIRQLRSLFASLDVQYVPYQDDQYFSHAGREQYFKDIPRTALSASVVFLDPDNGLEVKSARSGASRYVRYVEVADLYRRLTAGSVLSVYQHIPHVKRRGFLLETCHRLSSALGADATLCVSDNEIAFFLVTREREKADQLRASLQSYSKRHGLIFGAVEYRDRG